MQILEELQNYSLVEKQDCIESGRQSTVRVHPQLVEVGRRLMQKLQPPKGLYLSNMWGIKATNASHCPLVSPLLTTMPGIFFILPSWHAEFSIFLRCRA